MEKPRPLVSIIVRTKDRPKLLKKALKSIAAQTYRPLEVVLVNDGGCDLDTKEIMHTLGDIALNYVRLEKNMGRAYAGNAGARNSRGSYIGFLDDDDTFYPDHIETLTRTLEEWDFQVAYSDAHISAVDPGAEDTELAETQKRVFSSKDFSFSELVTDNYIPLMTIVFSSKTFKETGGFDESFDLYEDWDLLIRIAARSPFCHIKKTTAHYLQWSATAQVAQSPEFLEKADAAHCKIIDKHRALFTPEIIRSLVADRRALNASEKRVSDKEELLRGLQEDLRRKDTETAALQDTIRQKDTETAALKEMLGKKEQLLTDLQGDLRRKETDLAALDKALRARETDIAELKDAGAGLERALRDKTEALDLVYNSHGWRLLLSYYRVRDYLLPPQSKRRVLIKTVFKTLANPEQNIRKLNAMTIRKFFYYLRHADPSVLEYKVNKKLSGSSSAGQPVQPVDYGVFATQDVTPPDKNRVLLIGDWGLDAVGPHSDWKGLFVGHLRSLDYQVSQVEDDEMTEDYFRKHGGRFCYIIGTGAETCLKLFPFARAYAPQGRLIYVSTASNPHVETMELINVLTSDRVVTDSDQRGAELSRQGPSVEIEVIHDGEDMRPKIGRLMASVMEKSIGPPELPEMNTVKSPPAASGPSGSGNGVESKYRAGGAVLVAGIYLAGQKNSIEHIVGEFRKSGNFNVTQRWAALGGEAPSAEVDAVTVLKSKDPAPKMMLINRLLEGQDLKKYDYIILCDDDILLPENFLDDFLGLQGRYDFAAAQPARTHNSYIDHFIVEQLDGLRARRTRFVEIGPLVSYRRDLIPHIFPFDQATPMGWGFDYVLPCIAEKHDLRIGIIDATPVDHSMRKPVQNYKYSDAKKAMETYLSSNAHLSREEAFSILEAYS
ncbi:MAG: glycosyltransferase [Nitrospirae bacterium]|nr:glycosyltransferase [Nitrospirota bacterium]